MKEHYDDLMNRYLDGELKGSELREFEEMLKSEENTKSFNMLKSVDGLLRKVPKNNLSSGFTYSVMAHIQKSIKARREEKRFFFIVVSVFLFMILCLLVFVLAESYGGTVSQSSQLVNNSVHYLKKGLDYLKYFFPTKSVSLIGGLISFGMLITAWFFINFRGKKA